MGTEALPSPIPTLLLLHSPLYTVTTKQKVKRYLTNYIYNFTFSMYYVYNGFYVFNFIAHCWATFNALHALLSSHIMTNKDYDDDDSTQISSIVNTGPDYLIIHMDKIIK